MNRIGNPFTCDNNGYPWLGWSMWMTDSDTAEGMDLYYKLFDHCREYGFKKKQYDKVHAEYDNLIKLYPSFTSPAKCMLGYYYLRSDGNVASYEEGYRLLEEGLADAETEAAGIVEEWLNKPYFFAERYHLKGWCHLTGRGTEQDFDQAFKCFLIAREYDSKTNPRYKPDEKYLLPLLYCYILGIGTPVDFEMAIDSFNGIDGRMKHWNYRGAQSLDTDTENQVWAFNWSRIYGIEETVVRTYREGMVDWLINRDFERAKASFEQAIELGFLPAMSELGMMYLDDDWGLKDGEDLFIKTLSEAADAGYIPSNYIIGQRILNHWGKKNPFSSSNEGEAFPYFLACAKEGFPPAIEQVKRYENGTYSTKTGLAAALSDLNEGFNDGQTEKKSLFENLLEVGSGYASLGYAISARNSASSGNVATGQNTSTVSSHSSGSSGSSESVSTLSDSQIHWNNDAVKLYAIWEEKAKYWIDCFMKEYAWLELSDPKSDSNLELQNHHRAYRDARTMLKSVLFSLQHQRQKNDTIPKGEIEEEVEWCLAQKYPE